MSKILKNPKEKKESEELQYLKYKAQTEQEILELNTDEDKVTTITEKNIIKKVRDVYGQRAADMINSKIDWASWGVELNPKERPNPYDFPAFLRAVEDVGEKKGGGGGKHRKGEKSGYKSNKRSKKVSKDLEGLDTKSAVANDNYSELPVVEDLFPNDDGGGGGGKAGGGGGETALGFDENEKNDGGDKAENEGNEKKEEDGKDEKD
uniref:Uncharacterized protein n=1 Tax=Meloidogyne incognita TaxID=6306 RepID=A0A914NHU7_MELIC